MENEIYQTKNRSGQDPLNYPIRLNNEIAALGGSVASADARPTNQAYSVFTQLSMRLDVQLLTLQRDLKDLLPRVNAALAAAKLPEIVPSTAELKVAGAARPAAGEEEEEAEETPDW